MFVRYRLSEDAEEEWEEVSVICPKVPVKGRGRGEGGREGGRGKGGCSSLAAQTRWTPAGRWRKIESPQTA